MTGRGDGAMGIQLLSRVLLGCEMPGWPAKPQPHDDDPETEGSPTEEVDQS